MAIFKPATVNTQACLKAGLLGFTGSGKTRTAAELAIGLVQRMREQGIAAGTRPVLFLDTEKGSDWVARKFSNAGLELRIAKTRAFNDLIAAVAEAEATGSVLIIDSITQFWDKLCDDYTAKNGRLRGLEASDWQWLKQEWRRFSDCFVNSQCHIIMCGRAGYEYGSVLNDAGKRELEKIGVKMRADTDIGYDPSILILMERHHDAETGRTWRTAHVLKDRADLIDGRTFENPSFEDFLPHIDCLNLGGVHVGFDSERGNDEMFGADGSHRWAMEKRAKEIALDEISQTLAKYYPGQTTEDRQSRLGLLEAIFGSRSWERIKTFDLATVKIGRNELWLRLEGFPYTAPQPVRPPPENPEEFDDVPQ